MSRFKPRNNNQHPCTLWLEWGGADGNFRYYDKAAGTRVPFELGRFIVLDVLSTITGYDESSSQGVYANEVRDTTKQEITVRSKSGVIKKGLYSQIKESLPKGIKFTSSIYIAVEVDGEVKLGNIKLSGAALNSWVDFQKNNRMYDGAVKFAEVGTGKKGAVSYKFPKFTLEQSTPQEEESAKGVWQLLEDYLEAYFGTATPPPATDTPLTQGEEELLAEESDDEDFPF